MLNARIAEQFSGRQHLSAASLSHPCVKFWGRGPASCYMSPHGACGGRCCHTNTRAARPRGRACCTWPGRGGRNSDQCLPLIQSLVQRALQSPLYPHANRAAAVPAPVGRRPKTHREAGAGAWRRAARQRASTHNMDRQKPNAQKRAPTHTGEGRGKPARPLDSTAANAARQRRSERKQGEHKSDRGPCRRQWAASSAAQARYNGGA